jgi:hypothetical protein
LKAFGKWRRRGARGDNLRNDFEAAQKVDGAIWLGETGVTVVGCQHDLRYIAGGIKHADPAKRQQLGCDIGAQTTIGEAEVEDGKIRLVMLRQGDRFGHRAGDAANFVPLVDENLFH